MGMSSDPLGLSSGQRAQSNQNVIFDRFIKRYGDRIKLAADGTWYVEDDGEVITVPLPAFPIEHSGEGAGMTLAECVAIAKSGAVNSGNRGFSLTERTSQDPNWPASL